VSKRITTCADILLARTTSYGLSRKTLTQNGLKANGEGVLGAPLTVNVGRTLGKRPQKFQTKETKVARRLLPTDSRGDRRRFVRYQIRRGRGSWNRELNNLF